MDTFGDHALYCAIDVGIKFLHVLVCDTLEDACYRAGVPARKEEALGILSNDGSYLRPADILVYNWDNGQHTCFDVISVSPFIGGGVLHSYEDKLSLMQFLASAINIVINATQTVMVS